jgi:hypothetical protein
VTETIDVVLALKAGGGTIAGDGLDAKGVAIMVAVGDGGETLVQKL